MAVGIGLIAMMRAGRGTRVLRLLPGPIFRRYGGPAGAAPSHRSGAGRPFLGLTVAVWICESGGSGLVIAALGLSSQVGPSQFVLVALVAALLDHRPLHPRGGGAGPGRGDHRADPHRRRDQQGGGALDRPARRQHQLRQPAHHRLRRLCRGQLPDVARSRRQAVEGAPPATRCATRGTRPPAPWYEGAGHRRGGLHRLAPRRGPAGGRPRGHRHRRPLPRTALTGAAGGAVRPRRRHRRPGGIVAEVRPDVVFHEAAQIDVWRSMSDPALDTRINVLGTVNLLQACAAAGVRRFVFATAAAPSTGTRRRSRRRRAPRSCRHRTTGRPRPRRSCTATSTARCTASSSWPSATATSMGPARTPTVRRGWWPSSPSECSAVSSRPSTVTAARRATTST